MILFVSRSGADDQISDEYPAGTVQGGGRGGRNAEMPGLDVNNAHPAESHFVSPR